MQKGLQECWRAQRCLSCILMTISLELKEQGVLPQCPALSILGLKGNQIGDQGAGVLAGVLPQCPALSTLGLGDNQIGDQGAGRLAGMLPQCRVLSHLYI